MNLLARGRDCPEEERRGAARGSNSTSTNQRSHELRHFAVSQKHEGCGKIDKKEAKGALSLFFQEPCPESFCRKQHPS
jgi:hypothetical protein